MTVIRVRSNGGLKVHPLPKAATVKRPAYVTYGAREHSGRVIAYSIPVACSFSFQFLIVLFYSCSVTYENHEVFRSVALCGFVNVVCDS